MEEKVKIIVAAHKPFTPFPKMDEKFHIVTTDQNDICNNYNNLPIEYADNLNVPMEKWFYGELYQMKWALENLELPEYVGLCHYRRVFPLNLTQQNIESIIKKHGIILPNPMNFGRISIKKQFGNCHNIEDLEICENIVHELYPEYTDSLTEALNRNKMHPYNMFISKREFALEWCDFIFTILKKFVEIIGTDIEERIKDNISDYHNVNIEYQRRLGGFLSERLFNAFTIKNCKNQYYTKINS